VTVRGWVRPEELIWVVSIALIAVSVWMLRALANPNSRLSHLVECRALGVPR
jgi:hypothetical protein